MPRDGTLNIAGEVSGELSPLREVTGELQSTGKVTGELSLPTERAATRDYDLLENKPQIEGVVLQGNKTFGDLGDHTLTNIEIKEIFDRIFKGGN